MRAEKRGWAGLYRVAQAGKDSRTPLFSVAQIERFSVHMSGNRYACQLKHSRSNVVY
mgnify:CR=1 FL=1